MMNGDNMSESKGRSESIYFNSKEIEKIDTKANELGISTKELIKARCLSDDGHILIQKRMSFDREIYENIKAVGDALREIDCFYSSLDAASHELLVHKDITEMRYHHNNAIELFKATMDMMRGMCLKTNVG